MNTFTRLLACAGLVTLLAACAASPDADRPAWIDGPSERWPASAWLVGRGQSPSRAIAQDRARADLAKNFSVRVAETSRDVTRYEGSQPAGKSATGTVRRSARREIETRTEQILRGVEIADLWRDPQSGEYHALAVLDRMQAAAGLREFIADRDAATAREIALAREAADPLTAARHATRAVTLQVAREEAQRLLKVVDPSGLGEPSRWQLEVLRSDRDALLARVRIRTQVVADPVGDLEPLLAGAVADAGFAAGSDAAGYLLRARLELTPLIDEQGWHWYRGSLQLELLDLPDRQPRGSVRWPVKVSARDAGTARQRVLDEIGRRLQQDLRRTLIAF